MGLWSRAPRPARDMSTAWWPWVPTSMYSEGTHQVRRHAALAGHRLGAWQILHRQVLRALLLCARGRILSGGGAGPDDTRAW